MKLIVTSKALAVCLTASTLFLSSCIDKDINMDKLSTDMAIGSTLAVPLGEANISIADLVNNYKTDSNVVINEKDGVVNLYFTDTLNYDNPATIDLSTFGSIKKSLVPGVTTGLPAIIVPAGTNQTYTVTEGYDFNDINKTPTEQRVDSIRFKNTTISSTVTTNLPAGLVSIDIQLPIEFEGQSSEVVKMDLTGASTTKDFDLQNFVVKADGKSSTTFPIYVTIHGDGTTPISSSSYININISLKNSKFVAYGFFNNDTVINRKEDLKLNLYSVLPEGSLIYPHNPEFEFDLISNIGVPLLFNLSGLKTYEKTTTSKTATFNGSTSRTSVIDRPTVVGTTKTTSIIFNNDADKGNISNLFKIKVDSASADFNFGIEPKPITTSDEFVTSDSKVQFRVGMNVPFWLDEGSVITYSDTIENIDIGSTITEAALYLQNTNKLPVKLTVYMKLLDSNKKLIATAGVKQYDVDAATVDSEGASVSAASSKITVSYNTSTIGDFRKAKYIELTVSCNGYDTSSKMKFRMQDLINIKVSAYAKGGVSIY